VDEEAELGPPRGSEASDPQEPGSRGGGKAEAGKLLALALASSRPLGSRQRTTLTPAGQPAP
jgi:hypothetical protein